MITASWTGRDTKYQFRRGFQHDERNLPGPHVNTRRGSNATSILAQQVGELSNIRRNPSRLIARERLGSRAPMVAVQKIDLPVLLS